MDVFEYVIDKVDNVYAYQMETELEYLNWNAFPFELEEEEEEEGLSDNAREEEVLQTDLQIDIENEEDVKAFQGVIIESLDKWQPP